jgi:hypothetical protein
MSTDPLRELIRAQVRQILQEEVKAAVGEIVAEEVKSMVSEALPAKTQPLQLAPSPNGNGRAHYGPQRHGKLIKVAVNPKLVLPPWAAGTKTARIWRTASEHLGEKVMDRTTFTKELATLVDMDPIRVSRYVTAFLDRKALLSVPLDFPQHRVGDAYAG